MSCTAVDKKQYTIIALVHSSRHDTNNRCVITWDMYSVNHMVTIAHCAHHNTDYRCVITLDIFCVYHMVTIVNCGCVWPGCHLTLQMPRLTVCLPVDASSVCCSTQGGAHHSYNTNKPLHINMSHQQCTPVLFELLLKRREKTICRHTNENLWYTYYGHEKIFY